MPKLCNREVRANSIYPKLIIKIPEYSPWWHSGVFVSNYKQILEHVLVLLLSSEIFFCFEDNEIIGCEIDLNFKLKKNSLKNVFQIRLTERLSLIF